MKKNNICAIATPVGTGSISCIRVSGETCFEEVNKCFKGKDILKQKPNTIFYGHIVDEFVIDEVMVAKFEKPKSFSGENMLEIFTHGGILVTKKVLETLLKQDIRLAEPGEFSMRAYLNNRIDLVQAESIMDIVSATNINSLKIANSGLNKKTSQRVNELGDDILDIITKIEVNIDYPEYDDILVMTNDIIIPKLDKVIDKISKTISLSNQTKIIKEGIKTVILGKPNVGKSSILNTLIGENKAIVTNIAGTTRDLVEASLSLGNITLNLVDTAGIRETKNQVEKMGVIKSIEALEKCDLVLLVLDNSKKINDKDKYLLELSKNKPRIIIGNKLDLADKLDYNVDIKVSAKSNLGLDELEKLIIKKLELNNILASDENNNYLSNSRQISKLEICLSKLKDARLAASNNLPVDLISVDLTSAYKEIADILGKTYDSDIPNNIFKNFCLGK